MLPKVKTMQKWESGNQGIMDIAKDITARNNRK
jgi:hypothetical protein